MTLPEPQPGLPDPRTRLIKRAFDVAVAAFGLLGLWWLLLIALLAAAISTRSNGLFVQQRVGLGGKLIRVYKLRTMRDRPDLTSTVTTAGDPRITRVGALLRRAKLDELPQLVNVLFGQMSLVGPRPDVPGFADRLEGEDRLLLAVRPGITGPATLRYRNEEALLAMVDNPEQFNRDYIYPDKVRINLAYLRRSNLFTDIRLLFATVAGARFSEYGDAERLIRDAVARHYGLPVEEVNVVSDGFAQGQMQPLAEAARESSDPIVFLCERGPASSPLTATQGCLARLSMSNLAASCPDVWVVAGHPPVTEAPRQLPRAQLDLACCVLSRYFAQETVDS